MSTSSAVAAPLRTELPVRVAPVTFDSIYEHSVEHWFDLRRQVEEAAMEGDEQPVVDPS